MAFSLTHTISYVDANTPSDTWFPYICDTFLPSRGWTVTNGGTYNRKLTRSDWINAWDGTTRSEDVGFQYTTSGGSSNFTADYWIPSLAATGGPTNVSATLSASDLKFWTSDDSDAYFITCNRALVQFWPGSTTEWFLYGQMDTNTSSGGTHPSPWFGTNWLYGGGPGTTSSTSSCYVSTGIGHAIYTATAPSGQRLTLFPQPLMCWSSTSITNTGHNGPGFKIKDSNINVGYGDPSSSYYGAMNWGSGAGIAYDGTNYYIMTDNMPSSYGMLALNMGTTSPDF